MTRGEKFTVVALIAICINSSAFAQQATPPYGSPISLEQAKKVLAAAEAEAQKNNWPVVITVVDTGGFLVAMQRLDNTQLGSIPVAEEGADLHPLPPPIKGVRRCHRQRRNRPAGARVARRDAV